MYLVNVLIGTILLTLGRKLFWLFVGCVGFVFGLQVAHQYLAAQPSWIAWAAAVLIGLIGALLAVFFQTLAIGLGGFTAGSTIMAYLTVLTGFTVHPLLNVIGGIIGVIVLYAVFDWALIFLSSLVGATLIVQSFHWNSPIESVLYVILFVIGILVQTFLWRGQKNKME
jgi:hypothetical protein